MRVPLVLAGLGAVALGLVLLRYQGTSRLTSPALPRGAGQVSPTPGVLDEVPLSLPGVLSVSQQRSAARAAVVINATTGAVLSEQEAFTPHPIASLAKLMSAMVALDRQPDLGALAAIMPAEYTIRGGNLRLLPGEQVTVQDLLFASITGSANNAAFALPRVLGMTDEEFLEEMSRKAVALGLETLRFVDTAGLSPQNVGSAYDVARMAAHAFTHYPLIAQAASTREYRIMARGSGPRTSAGGSLRGGREHVLRNSNPLLHELEAGAESKTGYLNESLFCLVLTRRSGPDRLVGVLLGHPAEYGVIQEARALLQAAAGSSGISPRAGARVP